MDSPTFSYRVTPRPGQNSGWVVEFKCTDVLHRRTSVSGVILPLPGQTATSFFVGSVSHVKATNNNAIVEITSGLRNENTGVSTRHASFCRDQFNLITSAFSEFGVTRELYTEILTEINDYLRRNPRERGGEIKVWVWRVRSQIVQRHEDPEVDAYVEMMFPSSPKPIPADSTAIDSLKIIRFSRECVICKEDFVDGSMITRLPCGHMFHGVCIKNWLQINRECPLCRKPIS